VTETVNNPQTGQPQTVVVRQQSGFWAPFAGAIAGQAIGSLLFRPQYYMPPVYQPGIMRGYGGYGNTYGQAVNQYQTRYRTPPPAVRNRQVLRTTGRLRSPTSNVPLRNPAPPNANRSTGSGYGGSTLRRSPNSNSRQQRRSPSFGSGRNSRQPSRQSLFWQQKAVRMSCLKLRQNVSWPDIIAKPRFQSGFIVSNLGQGCKSSPTLPHDKIENKTK
jgi:hypothetical protein